MWKNDSPYSFRFDGKTIDSMTPSLDLPDHSFPELSSFVLKDWYSSLQTITIGDDSFSKVRSFELCDLEALESLTIGKSCFRISSESREDGCLKIAQCPLLRSIQIGDWSFDDYVECVIQELPLLRSIQMGEYCFTLVNEFSLHGVLSSLLLPLDLPELEIIRLDRYVFANTYSISFASGSFHLLANQICLGFAPLFSIPMPLPAIGTILWRLSTESPSTLGSHSP